MSPVRISFLLVLALSYAFGRKIYDAINEKGKFSSFFIFFSTK